MTHIIDELYDVIEDRREEPDPESYTSTLLDEGEDAVIEKLGEEVTETMLAAKNGDADNLVHESADVVYHLLVLLAANDVDVERLEAELRERRGD